MNDNGDPVLYAIVTGASVAGDVGELVDLARADGWDVCVIASPEGRRFIDTDALAAATGHPVRSEYKDPGAPDVLPPADAMIAAPITCNSVAKWAAGISDTLPLGLLVEAVGNGLPVVAVPFSNRAQMSFPAVQEAIRKLSDWGVVVLDIYQQHEPGAGENFIDLFPWTAAWRAVREHPRSPRTS
jgi:phosphopantothenoylcysteine synthetase/decarboxylase